MNGRQIFILSESRNPFELYLLIACVLSGISGIAAPDKSSSAVQEVLSRPMQYTWYIGLMLGGVLALFGMVKNLFVKRIGITVLGGITLAYSLILFYKMPRPFSMSFFVVLSFSVACIIRVVQISKHVKGERL